MRSILAVRVGRLQVGFHDKRAELNGCASPFGVLMIEAMGIMAQAIEGLDGLCLERYQTR